MKKLLSRLVWLPVGLIVVVFLFANRQLVAVSLDPVSVDNPAIATPALPLWVWLTASLLIGFFLGALGMWMSGRRRRKIARAEHRELKALRKELAAAQPKIGAGRADAPQGAANDAETVPTLKATSI